MKAFHGDFSSVSAATPSPNPTRAFTTTNKLYQYQLPSLPPDASRRLIIIHGGSGFSPKRGLLSLATKTGSAQLEKEAEVAEGVTMTQFCDKMIDFFLNEKTVASEWRKLLVFRKDWKKYQQNFYSRCRERAANADQEDETMKNKLTNLCNKIKKIDDEMEGHDNLYQELRENPRDTNLVVARRRKDFDSSFFSYLNFLADINDGLEDRDDIARLATRCLAAIRAYDNAITDAEDVEIAQSKFDEIFSSNSLDEAREKITSMGKSKDLSSTLILLINRAWASAKDSTTISNEAKEIMHEIYKTTKSSLKSIVPQEIKLLKHLLNIKDPEERFSALATAFSPGSKDDAKIIGEIYTTPKELHKWVTIMLDAYHLNKEETEIREVKKMAEPMVIQRLCILKETIEQEYMSDSSGEAPTKDPSSASEDGADDFGY